MRFGSKDGEFSVTEEVSKLLGDKTSSNVAQKIMINRGNLG
jgi:hypothetical protein